MDKRYNYRGLFNQALARIKAVRAPRADRLETKDLNWDVVQSQALFNFGGEDFDKSVTVYEAAENISISCLQFLIGQLFEKYKCPFEPVSVDISTDEKALRKVKFAFKDSRSNTLLLFKEIEDSSLWKIKDREPNAVTKLLQQNKCSACKYVYLMFDYAYLQLVGHNDDVTDPGRGYNLYSLKWFFEEYFGVEEYQCFYEAATAYISEVNSYIGYATIKTLIPSLLINFRKNVESIFVNLKYSYKPKQ